MGESKNRPLVGGLCGLQGFVPGNASHVTMSACHWQPGQEITEAALAHDCHPRHTKITKCQANKLLFNVPNRFLTPDSWSNTKNKHQCTQKKTCNHWNHWNYLHFKQKNIWYDNAKRAVTDRLGIPHLCHCFTNAASLDLNFPWLGLGAPHPERHPDALAIGWLQALQEPGQRLLQPSPGWAAVRGVGCSGGCGLWRRGFVRCWWFNQEIRPNKPLYTDNKSNKTCPRRKPCHS